jgi:hypothetical protein
VPLTALADFSGNYFGLGKADGLAFTELFTLTPGADLNSYDVVGTGPGYALVGTAYVSGLKRFAYVSVSDETTNGVGRSLTGPFSLTKGTGSLIGVKQIPSSLDTQRIKLKITKQ